MELGLGRRIAESAEDEWGLDGIILSAGNGAVGNAQNCKMNNEEGVKLARGKIESTQNGSR
jgi:hypothetical protein